MSEIVAETDIKLLQGGDEELNLLYALSNISKIFKGLWLSVDVKWINKSVYIYKFAEK